MISNQKQPENVLKKTQENLLQYSTPSGSRKFIISLQKRLAASSILYMFRIFHNIIIFQQKGHNVAPSIFLCRTSFALRSYVHMLEHVEAM